VVDLRAVLESVLGLYRARLANAGVEAVVKCESGLTLRCYEGELRQILVNLISNAFDAMRSGGRLSVRVREVSAASIAGGRIHILVADTGTGIPPDILSRVFEPFFSTKGIGGTGLGLWITRDLVTKNDGTISIRTSTTSQRSGTACMLSFKNSGSENSSP